MSDRYVLDASALLCLLSEETGSARVAALVDDAIISAVNFSEVVSKIVERGASLSTIEAMLNPLHLPIVDFDRAQAVHAGALRAATRTFGLSFGDRTCLGLAISRHIVAVTGDRAWANLPLDVQIEVVR